jgi:hypothetical protein
MPSNRPNQFFLMMTFLVSVFFARESYAISPAIMTETGGKISNLSWASQTTPVEILRNKFGKPYAQVKFKAVYTRAGWSLIVNNRILKKYENDSQSFELSLILTGEETEVELTAVGPYGDVQKDTLAIEWDGFYVLLQNDPEFHASEIEKSERPWRAQLGLGVTQLNYLQTQAPEVSETALTLKGGIYHDLKKNWDVSGSGYWNSVLLSSKPDPYTITLYGLNGRVGYRFRQVRYPWALKVMFGWYYMTMAQATGGIGFSGVNGPQLFPMLNYAFKSKASISTYIKFSPVSDRFNILQIGSYEFASGVSYYPAKKILFNHPIGISFDYSQAGVKLTYGKFKLQTYTLGVTSQISWK